MKLILAESNALIARCKVVKPMWNDESKCDQCSAQGACGWNDHVLNWYVDWARNLSKQTGDVTDGWNEFLAVGKKKRNIFVWKPAEVIFQ